MTDHLDVEQFVFDPYDPQYWENPFPYYAEMRRNFPAYRREVENHRVRQDVVDEGGTVTLRYVGKLRHLGVGRAHKGTRVLLFVAGADVRVVTLDGELLRTFTIDPTKDYQGQ